MKKYLATLYRKLISPSLRFELRDTVAWLREHFDRACLWRWEITKFPLRDDSQYYVLYAGRKERREFAMTILGIKGVVDAKHGDLSSRRILVSEMTLPGALHVPRLLRNIVPLGRPVEEIIAECDSNLRRYVSKNRARYRLQQMLTEAEVDRVDQEMLQPFATARHGSSVIQIPSEAVRRCALEYGRLDLVLLGDEAVGCLLGYVSIRAGKRYWVAERYGCPETVFSDSKRLSETNSIIYQISIEQAIEYDCEFCDFELSFASPDDRILQVKRRRGCMLDIIDLKGGGYFHIRLPVSGVAQFLWDSPLFAVERHKLTLHLGLPDGRNNEEVMGRYREMGFRGLFKVYLHCAKPPSEHILDIMRSLYMHQKSPPILQIILST